MKAFVAILWVLAAFPGDASACSLGLSKPFQVGSTSSLAAPSIAAHLESVDLLPNIGTGDSCDGVGFIVVTLTGKPFRKFKRQGFLVRPIAGVRDPEVFPSHALAAHIIKPRTITLTWGWVRITPDDDGEVRWHFQVIPVSPSGIQGEPLDVCVATDDSCPTQDASRLRPDSSFKPIRQQVGLTQPIRFTRRVAGPNRVATVPVATYPRDW